MREYWTVSFRVIFRAGAGAVPVWCGVDVVTPHSIYGTPLTAPPPPSVKRHIDRTLIVLRLGHAMYWRDLRAVNRRMTEPYFGGDLEMELGDSFVASEIGRASCRERVFSSV